MKTHKCPSPVVHSQFSVDIIRTHPIVSSCGGPSDRLSWLLVWLLSFLLQFVEAHIVNVEGFLSSLSDRQLPPTAARASFDVVSLYAKVNNNCAVKAVIPLYKKWKSSSKLGLLARRHLDWILCFPVTSSSSRSHISNKSVAWPWQSYCPFVAITFLGLIEKMSLTSRIPLKRYIHDVFVTGATEVEVETMLQRLNLRPIFVLYDGETWWRAVFLSWLPRSNHRWTRLTRRV